MSEDESNDRNGDKKAKVLHTRVPEALERELKDKANSLGLSVSTLVRNILGNAFELVEDIVTDSANIARTARGVGLWGHAQVVPKDGSTAAGVASPLTSRVLGWHESILNLNAVCDRCNAVLPRGRKAAIAVLEGPGSKPIVCLDCLAEIIHVNDVESDASEL